MGRIITAAPGSACNWTLCQDDGAKKRGLPCVSDLVLAYLPVNRVAIESSRNDLSFFVPLFVEGDDFLNGAQILWECLDYRFNRRFLLCHV